MESYQKGIMKRRQMQIFLNNHLSQSASEPSIIKMRFFNHQLSKLAPPKETVKYYQLFM